MNAPEYERMYRLEDTYWWFQARHRLVENLLRKRYGAGYRVQGLGSRKNEATSVSSTLNPIPYTLRLLDVGCGTGAMSARLTKWGQVVSADFSPLALQFSRRRNLTHLLRADAMRLPIASEAFDVAVVMDVLEHLPDDRAALCELNRVLKPGGRVIATVPAYPHLWSEHDIALMHHRRYVKRELQARFTEAGFQIEKLSHTMMLLYPIVALQRRLNAHKPPHDPPQAAMPMVPAPLNAALTALLGLENAFARRLNFPYGLSFLAIGVKP